MPTRHRRVVDALEALGLPETPANLAALTAAASVGIDVDADVLGHDLYGDVRWSLTNGEDAYRTCRELATVLRLDDEHRAELTGALVELETEGEQRELPFTGTEQSAPSTDAGAPGDDETAAPPVSEPGAEAPPNEVDVAAGLDARTEQVAAIAARKRHPTAKKAPARKKAAAKKAPARKRAR